MKVVLLALLGLIAGAFAGGLIGIGAGMLWVEIAHTSSREGAAGMLVFFGFMPLGVVIGAIAGAAWLGTIAMRRSQRSL
jgi:hypothetical protein